MDGLRIHLYNDAASIARGIIDDDSVRVTVVDAEKNKVEHNGAVTSLSPLAEKLRNVPAIQELLSLHTMGKRLRILQRRHNGKKNDCLSWPNIQSNRKGAFGAFFLFFFCLIV